jgi:hypothetical protein
MRFGDHHRWGAAVEFAINSPYPDPSKVIQDIYA